MRHHNERTVVAVLLCENAFENFDGLNVKMICRFIKEQQIGLEAERQGKRRFFLFTARSGLRVLLTCRTKTMQIFIETSDGCPLFTFVGNVFKTAACEKTFSQSVGFGKVRFLFEINRNQTVLTRQNAVVQFVATGKNMHQRTFAGAVAADEANAFTGIELHLGSVQ